jgi:hypothetical protein
VLEEHNFEPDGFTIFCDDVREEKSNKDTYVGVLGDVMFLAVTPPVVIAQFYVVILLFADPGAKPKALQLRVALPGEDAEKPTIKIDVDVANVLPGFDSSGVGDTITRPRRRYVFKISLAPLLIQSFGRIRVSALWDDKSISLGSLAVAPVPQSI